MITENIYGHAKRLGWIVSRIHKSDRILEFGCGTGYMITLPLAKMDYNVTGIDMDRESIDYGRTIFAQEGVEPRSLQATNIADIDVLFDIIIASEVLEHIPDSDLSNVFVSMSSKLKPDGMLLITVPNGYGWFEFESFVWNKLFIGRCLEWLKIVMVINKLKQLAFGKNIEPIHPSTLSPSPHVQRFTLRSIQNKISEHGFDIVDVKGSVLFCGQFSNLLFTGIKPIMKLNVWLGSKLTRCASAYYIAAIKTVNR